MAPADRIGTPCIPADIKKIVAVIESDYQDQTTANHPEDGTSRAIAVNLIEFLEFEVKHGRLPPSLLPLQSGIGNIALSEVWSIATPKISKCGPRSYRTHSLTSLILAV
jgi:acetyl-CoA hydrolase